MKSVVKIVSTALALSTLTFYCVLDQRYIQLEDGERLFNNRLYSELGKAVTLGYDMKGFSENIQEPYQRLVKIRTNPEEAKRQVTTLFDYTVKLQTPCSSGTGWFLDYEIPKDNSYPTKWFIATNAHVINKYKFDSNPYNQSLPIKGLLSGCSRNGEPTPVYLLKDQKANVNNFQTSTYTFLNQRNTNVNLAELIDSVAWNAKDNRSQDKAFVYSKLESPKLFYVPTNFLGQRYSSSLGLSWGKINYIKDFAVLEVNFSSETEAKNLTNDFYNKQRENKINEINFFSNELIEKMGGDELVKNEEDYFFAGYPGSEYDNTYKFSLTTNYSSTNQKVGKLILIRNEDPGAVRNKFDQALPGHRMGSLKVNWNKHDYSYWGYEYAITNINDVAPGASGSIIIDSKGDALGILTSMATVTRFPVIFVTPLKSNGLILNSKLIYPPYDLIKGNKWQIGSYKEQLDKYYPNINTYLRTKW